MLETRDLHAYYGKSHILHGVDLRLGKGEIVSLLGRNGVGRSTTIKAIMGQVAATGSIKFKDQELVGRKAFEIAHLGIGYVPENRDIFPTLTVTYTWSPSAAIQGSINTFSIIAKPTTTATIIYTLTLSNGLCVSTKTISIQVFNCNPPIVSFTTLTNDSICTGGCVTFTSTTSGSASAR